MLMREMPHSAKPFQNGSHRSVEIDMPRFSGLGVFGRQNEITLLQIHPVPLKAEDLSGPHAGEVADRHDVRRITSYNVCYTKLLRCKRVREFNRESCCFY